MNKCIRVLLDAADMIGNVEEVFTLNWASNSKRYIMEGHRINGVKFTLILEMENEEGDKDGT